MRYPLALNIYKSLNDFVPTVGSAYLYSEFEERSHRSVAWLSQAENVDFIRIVLNNDRNEFTPSNLSSRTQSKPYGLRNLRDLQNLLLSIGKSTCYIDITGMPHKLWMPLIKAGYMNSLNLRIVYCEPGEYAHNPNPTFYDIFDLSESIEGIAPIPTFASFREHRDEATVFIPMLSFEGARFAHLVEQIQPLDNKIFPIVGVPGFKLEYPFYSYFSNYKTLEENDSWKRVKRANASCPYSAYLKIEDIARQYDTDYIKLAPIGTKPHALGALLFHLKHPDNTEMVYDHPKDNLGRTTGVGKCYIYYISEFMDR